MRRPTPPGDSRAAADSPDTYGVRPRSPFDGLALALAVLINAALVFLAVSEPWVSDDFSGALFLREHPALWDSVASAYMTWTGRFSSAAFSWLALQVRPVYGIFIWLGLLSLVVLTFALASGRFPRARRADAYVLAVLLMTYWFGLPALEETVFWTAGSMVYLWPAVATLLFLYQYRRWDVRAGHTHAGIAAAASFAVGMFLLGVWVGGSQEQVLVACLAYLLVFAVRAARNRRLWQLPAGLYSGALGLTIAGAVSLVAPGNGARVAVVPSEGLLETGIAAAKYVVHIAVDWMPPMIPWLACLLLLAVPVGTVRGSSSAGDDARVESDGWLWVLLGVSTVVTLFVKPYFAAERTVMFLAVFLAVAAVSLQAVSRGGSMLERLPATVASAVVCALLLVTAGDVMLSGWQARTLRNGQLLRAEEAETLKRGGETDLILAPITYDAPRRGVMWGDGTADKTFWINGILASWYGADSVVISGEAQH